MKPGLRLLVAEHRDRGAEEGRVEAADLATCRRSLVRRTNLPAPATPRAAAMARALAELDVYDQEGPDR